jgi:hypothetical protein
MSELWTSLPDWAELLVRGLYLGLLMCAAAVAASRAGRSPYWGLCAIVPFLIIAVTWALAFCEWPTEKKANKS